MGAEMSLKGTLRIFNYVHFLETAVLSLKKVSTKASRSIQNNMKERLVLP